MFSVIAVFKSPDYHIEREFFCIQHKSYNLRTFSVLPMGNLEKMDVLVPILHPKHNKVTFFVYLCYQNKVNNKLIPCWALTCNRIIWLGHIIIYIIWVVMYEHFIHFITYHLSFRIGALSTFMWASNFCIAINRDDLLKKSHRNILWFGNM